MDEKERRERERQVMGIFDQIHQMGVQLSVSEGGGRVSMPGVAIYDESDSGDDALEDFWLSHAAARPLLAELEALTKTQEGRERLLEAYRRWQEEDC